MQWTAGRNAGFSEAAAGDLYCPPIDDEVYGFQQVNVQAQRDDRQSLWHRMRQMIATRKAQLALARGDVEFLDVEERSVLAFVRSDGGETVLAAHNLSAEPVEVALDLGEYAGSEAVDVLDGKPLSPVGEGAYALKLERHGYRWIRLG